MTFRLLLAISVLASACAGGHAPAAAPADQNGARTAAPASTQAIAEQKAGVPVNASAAILQDFSKRIAGYMDLHNKAAGAGPALKESNDAGAIKAAQEAMATNIQKLRVDAKAGDIFTPEIRTTFRRLMYPELKGEDGRDARAVIQDDAPVSVPLKINTRYTADMKPTVPSNVLANLPALPKQLEYRIVNNHLLLLDVDANLIVDFIPNAIS